MKQRKTLAICLAISAISTVIMAINVVINPDKSSIPVIACTGIVPVVLIIALLSSKKNDDK